MLIVLKKIYIWAVIIEFKGMDFGFVSFFEGIFCMHLFFTFFVLIQLLSGGGPYSHTWPKSTVVAPTAAAILDSLGASCCEMNLNSMLKKEKN